MRKTRSMFAVLAAGTAVAATLVLPGTASAATPCPDKYVCFYTEKDYKGEACIWSQSDPDWQKGHIKCSWADDTNVRSIINNGTSPSFKGVAYYTKKDFESRIGCTKQGKKGNLAGTYKVRSHQWVKGSCGD